MGRLCVGGLRVHGGVPRRQGCTVYWRWMARLHGRKLDSVRESRVPHQALWPAKLWDRVRHPLDLRDGLSRVGLLATRARVPALAQISPGLCGGSLSISGTGVGRI